MSRVRIAALCAALLIAPSANAFECHIALGRGWPPATENYGTAVQKLFAGDAAPALSFTLLPASAAESGVMLIPASGDDWLLRTAVASERVRVWEGGKLELRTEQAPDEHEKPIPADVAKRMLEGWREALSAAAPDGSAAPFSEDDAWLFVVADPDHPGQVLRVSGLKPGCDLGGLIRDQIDLLIEASDEGDEKREKRWRQLGESLDRLHQAVQKRAATAAQ